MCKWPPVYIEYTHKLVLLAVCIPGIQHALRVYGGRLVKFSSLRQIGFKLAEFKKQMAVICAAKSSADFLYEK